MASICRNRQQVYHQPCLPTEQPIEFFHNRSKYNQSCEVEVYVKFCIHPNNRFVKTSAPCCTTSVYYTCCYTGLTLSYWPKHRAHSATLTDTQGSRPPSGWIWSHKHHNVCISLCRLGLKPYLSARSVPGPLERLVCGGFLSKNTARFLLEREKSCIQI